MEFSFFELVTNPKLIVQTLGLIGIITIVFLETGAFFGFFLPGDSLLFTAGFFASQGHLSLSLLLICTFVAAVVGDSVGYAFGKKVGPSLFSRDDSVFFNKKHIFKAENFYKKYGRKTIILARFMPVIRTFAPIVAGIANMEYRVFFMFNVIGGFLWTWTMLWLGYGLGSIIPNPDRYIIPVIIIIIIISAAPGIRELYKEIRKGNYHI